MPTPAVFGFRHCHHRRASHRFSSSSLRLWASRSFLAASSKINSGSSTSMMFLRKNQIYIYIYPVCLCWLVTMVIAKCPCINQATTSRLFLSWLSMRLSIKLMSSCIHADDSLLYFALLCYIPNDELRWFIIKCNEGMLITLFHSNERLAGLFDAS